MAEITSSSTQQGSSKRPFLKKRSTKIDMTPMVDLAFLLLTFFILTRTFCKPHVLETTMPDRTGISSPVSASNIINVVLSGGDSIYWWMGLDPPVSVTDYSKDGIRRVLLEKGKANALLMVLIKPQDNSRFQNMVDILDEMDITGMKRFAIVEVTRQDELIMSGR